MHKIRSVVIIGIIALLGGIISASDPLPEEYLSRIIIEISSEKTSYLPYEHITIDFTSTNNRDFKIYVPPFGSMNGHFVIKDGSGEVHRPIMDAYYGSPDSLLPFQSYSGRGEIRDIYEINRPGKYTCQLTIDGWSSNTLDFEVIEPDGILWKAWRKYDEARKLRYGPGDSLNANFTKAYRLCHEIVEKHPSTMYAPLALRMAFSAPRLADRQSVLKKCREYIRGGINGELLDICLGSFVNTSIDLNDRAGAEEYLQSLITENRSPELRDRATEWLEKLRNRPEKK